MLKFSGSAGLLSCLIMLHDNNWSCVHVQTYALIRTRFPQSRQSLHQDAGLMPPSWYKDHAHCKNTETGMLLGISQKHIPRSTIHWFPEFCKSQCLPQFTAPFKGVWINASIADNKRTTEVQELASLKILQWQGKSTGSIKSTDCSGIALQCRAHKGSPPHWQWVSLQHKELICKWSFRRFTYGNLVTTSPSSKW